MRKKKSRLISAILALSMIIQLSVMANDTVPGNGKSSEPFEIITRDVATYYKDTDSKYHLAYVGGNFSDSYIDPKTEITSPVGGTKYDTTIKKLYVVDENVLLSTTLWDYVIPSRGDDGTITIAGGSLKIKGDATNAILGDSKAVNNKLNCSEVNDTEKTYVKGTFDEIIGLVIPFSDLTVGGSPVVKGAEEQPCDITITSGEAKISGYFKKITIKSGASVTVVGNTIAEELNCCEGAKLSVNKDNIMCVDGDSVKPSVGTLEFGNSTKWGHLPKGSYGSVSGEWIFDGDIEIDDTSCICSEDTLNISKDETYKLTVNDGKVKAAGGTVIAKGENVTLILANETGDVTAYGEFKKINFAGNKLTVPANKFIAATVEGKKYGVTPLQETVFESFGNELPKSSDPEHPFKFSDVEGPWNVNSENGDVINGNGAAVTITQDNVKISGEFESVDSQGHTVILDGDTVINGGEYKVNGTTPYKLTLTAGKGIISGNFQELNVSGTAEVEDSLDPGADPLCIDSENKEAINVSGGKLTLNNSETNISAQSSSNAVAAKVTGGEFYFLKGRLESRGVKANTVYVAKTGKFYLGTDNNKEDYASDNTPFVYAYGEGSICINANDGGEAWVRAGELQFNSRDSYGIWVNKNGIIHVYPNDQYGSKIEKEDALLYIHGDSLAAAAMWIDNGATFDIRGRGALLEGPEQSKLALYIHPDAKLAIETPISGGTYNGEVIYNGKDLTALIPANHYLRYDEVAPIWNSTNGTYGIGSYKCEDFIGGYTALHDENAFDGNYKDSFGELGYFYTVTDAEWELRYNMLNGLDYQIPVGMNSGILLDANVMNTPIWGMGKKQGDVNVASISTLFLAGRKIDYTGKNCKGETLDNIAKDENGYASCDKTDNLNTITVDSLGDLTVLDSVLGELDGTLYPLNYIGTGVISYSDKVDNKETFVVHNDGTLTIESGIASAGEGKLASVVNAHKGTTTIGTTNENDDNKIIKLICNSCSNGSANAQGIVVSGGTLYLNGAEVAGGDNGILVTDGIANINGGLVYAKWACGNALYTKGGTTFVHGGNLYGDNYDDQSAKYANSILIENGNVFLNVDEAHKAYTVDKPSLQTAKTHHINNIAVNGGLLVVGADMLKGETSSNTHNNGTLSIEGGKTIYYDGVTVGNTSVYGADDDYYTTQLYILDGDFAELSINNNDEYSDEYLFLYEGNDLDKAANSFEQKVQIHGGRFSAIDVTNLKLSKSFNATTLVGAWSNDFEFKTGNKEWTRFNHYAEIINASRDENGRWDENTNINSGVVPTSGARIGEDKKGIYIRNAADEIKTVAATDKANYKLYTNIWVGDLENDGTNICREYKVCEEDGPITFVKASKVDMNGFGIFGNRSDALIKVSKSDIVFENKNDVQAYYSNKIQNFSTVADSCAVAVEGGNFTNNGNDAVRSIIIGNTAVKSQANTTLIKCAIKGNIGISSTGTLVVNTTDVNTDFEGTNTGIRVAGGKLNTDDDSVISSIVVEENAKATINDTQILGTTRIDGGSLTLNIGADLKTLLLNDGEALVTGGDIEELSQEDGTLKITGGSISKVLQNNGDATVNMINGKIDNYEIVDGSLDVEKSTSVIDEFKKVGGDVELNGGKYNTIDAGTDTLSTIVKNKIKDASNNIITTNSFLLENNSLLESGEYSVDELDTKMEFVAPFVIQAPSTGTGGGGGGGGAAATYVNVVVNDGEKEATSKVATGKKVSSIEKPTKEKQIFAGWYSDEALTKPVSDDEVIKKGTTLYAAFEADPECQIVMGINKNDAMVFGEKVRNDVAPIIRNDRTMLPARFVAENLGASVEWDEESRTVIILSQDEEIEIRITIDSNIATINGKNITLDSPAFIENDRTYTPVRFIAEALGAEVEWDGEAREVIITK